MGGSISFRVDLRPGNLTVGTYNITRSVEIDPNNIWNNYGQETIGKVTVTEDLPMNFGGISTKTTSVDEVKTTEVIVQQSSPSGGGGGGGSNSPSITNIYNTYIIEPEKEGEQKLAEEVSKEEPIDTKEKGVSEKSSLVGIIGYTIGKFIEGLSDGSPWIGFLIMTIIVLGGLSVYLFIKKQK